MTEQTAVVPRDAEGKFLPGGPGGPGRPKGRAQSELVRALIEPHRTALIERALALTQHTDPFAAANGLRICLERLAPIPKQESERVEVPGLKEAKTFTDKCEAVVSAVATGDISAEAADRLLRMIGAYARAVAVDDFDRRLRALEAGHVWQPVLDDVSDLV